MNLQEYFVKNPPILGDKFYVKAVNTELYFEEDTVYEVQVENVSEELTSTEYAIVTVTTKTGWRGNFYAPAFCAPENVIIVERFNHGKCEI